MTDDSNSKEKKNPKEKNAPQSKKNELQKSRKPAPKKKKRTKDPNRHIVDLSNKFNKLSQQISPIEDFIRKACPTYELERQLMEQHDLMRFIEQNDWANRELDRFGGHNLNEILGADRLAEQAFTEAERSKAIFESLSRYHIEQVGNYHDLLYASSFVNEIIEDINERISWVDSIRIDNVLEVIEKAKDIIQIDVSDIFKISSDLKDFYSSLPDENFTIQDSDTIIYAGKSYDISEINALVYGSIKSLGLSKTGKLSHKVFLAAFKPLIRISDLFKRRIVRNIIIYLTVDLIKQPIYDGIKNIADIYIEPKEITSSEILSKDMNRSDFIRNFLNDFRMVDVDENSFLNVRKDSSKESEIIGKLLKGDLVRVLESKNNWSLVVWKNKEEQLEIKGWVSNNFLQKVQITDHIE